MRLAHPKLQRITQWARLSDDIRALVVTGSLARDDGSSDTFSDLDLQVITTDLKRYTSADNWLHDLGDVWIRYPLNQNLPYRLVWFRGGIKVDFQFLDIGDIHTMTAEAELPAEYIRGYHILLDKDDLFRDLPPSPRQFPQAPPPTAATVAETINEFWFEAIHVAQFIRRREFWVVQYRDWTMKGDLLRLLEWHAQCTRKETVNTWLLGRRISCWADKEALDALEGIWGAWEAQSLWDAFFVQLELFRRLSRDLAQALDYESDEKKHQEIVNYIRQLYREDGIAEPRG